MYSAGQFRGTRQLTASFPFPPPGPGWRLVFTWMVKASRPGEAAHQIDPRVGSQGRGINTALKERQLHQQFPTSPDLLGGEFSLHTLTSKVQGPSPGTHPQRHSPLQGMADLIRKNSTWACLG